MLVFVRESKAQKKVIKLAVTERADDVVEAFAAKFDMLKQGVVSRIYERFGALPEPVQKWFIGLTDGNEGEGMRLFAESLMVREDGSEGFPVESTGQAASQPPGPAKPETPPEESPPAEPQAKRRGRSR